MNKNKSNQIISMQLKEDEVMLEFTVLQGQNNNSSHHQLSIQKQKDESDQSCYILEDIFSIEVHPSIKNMFKNRDILLKSYLILPYSIDQSPLLPNTIFYQRFGHPLSQKINKNDQQEMYKANFLLLLLKAYTQLTQYLNPQIVISNIYHIRYKQFKILITKITSKQQMIANFKEIIHQVFQKKYQYLERLEEIHDIQDIQKWYEEISGITEQALEIEKLIQFKNSYQSQKTSRKGAGITLDQQELMWIFNTLEIDYLNIDPKKKIVQEGTKQIKKEGQNQIQKVQKQQIKKEGEKSQNISEKQLLIQKLEVIYNGVNHNFDPIPFLKSISKQNEFLILMQDLNETKLIFYQNNKIPIQNILQNSIVGQYYSDLQKKSRILNLTKRSIHKLIDDKNSVGYGNQILIAIGKMDFVVSAFNCTNVSYFPFSYDIDQKAGVVNSQQMFGNKFILKDFIAFTVKTDKKEKEIIKNQEKLPAKKKQIKNIKTNQNVSQNINTSQNKSLLIDTKKNQEKIKEVKIANNALQKDKKQNQLNKKLASIQKDQKIKEKKQISKEKGNAEKKKTTKIENKQKVEPKKLNQQKSNKKITLLKSDKKYQENKTKSKDKIIEKKQEKIKVEQNPKMQVNLEVESDKVNLFEKAQQVVKQQKKIEILNQIQQIQYVKEQRQKINEKPQLKKIEDYLSKVEERKEIKVEQESKKIEKKQSIKMMVNEKEQVKKISEKREIKKVEKYQEVKKIEEKQEIKIVEEIQQIKKEVVKITEEKQKMENYLEQKPDFNQTKVKQEIKKIEEMPKIVINKEESIIQNENEVIQNQNIIQNTLQKVERVIQNEQIEIERPNIKNQQKQIERPNKTNDLNEEGGLNL